MLLGVVGLCKCFEGLLSFMVSAKFYEVFKKDSSRITQSQGIGLEGRRECGHSHDLPGSAKVLPETATAAGMLLTLAVLFCDVAGPSLSGPAEDSRHGL